MYTPLSKDFLPAIISGGVMAVRVEGWYNGAIIAGCEDIPFSEGEVTVNAGMGLRRTLSLTVPEGMKYAALLDQHGTELRAYRGIQHPSGEKELIPLGVFLIDTDEVSVGLNGSFMTLTCPDRWAKVMRARFETPRTSTKTLTIKQQMENLLIEAVSGIDVIVTATSTSLVGALVWERDRAQALIDMATAIGAEVYFDVHGNGIIRNAPKLSSTVVWQVNAGRTGVLLGGNRSTDRQQTYNVVVCFPSFTDGSTPFTPQIVADNDPNSPTWVGGPMGRVPYFMPTSILKTAGAAALAAATRLRKVKSRVRKMTLESVVNPALDNGDVVEAYVHEGYSERHLIDSVNIPMTVTGTQSLDLKSSRPTGDVPESE